MNATSSAFFRFVRLLPVLLGCPVLLPAEQQGLFTYRVSNGTSVEISYFPPTATGPVEIPAEIAGLPVTSIGNTAFGGCAGMTSVSIPPTVTSIGSYAFGWCSGLTSVTIPSGVTFLDIGTFRNCTGLTSVVIPASIASIRTYAFTDCAGLTSVSIPPGVTSIGGAGFRGCSGLTSVSVPASVTSIGVEVFSRCGSLAAIVVEEGNPSFSAAAGVLFNKTGSSLLQYPGGKTGPYTIPSGVRAIAGKAFSDCAGLTGISLPSSLATIGYEAFSDCSGLTDITIPAATNNIERDAFSGCSSLAAIAVEDGNRSYSSAEGVLFGWMGRLLIQYPRARQGAYNIPAGVEYIENRSFSGCASLTGVAIPSSVISIGAGAFTGCGGLISVSIPSGVAGIGGGAFAACTGLASIVAGEQNFYYASEDGIFFSKDRKSLLQYPGGKKGPYVIPSGIRTIAWHAFQGCTGLTRVTIPGSVTSVGGVKYDWEDGFYGKGAFFGCTGLMRAVFLGDAPDMDGSVFSGTAPGFKVLHLSSRTGFTSPEWTVYWGDDMEDTYPAETIDQNAFPAAPWLLTYGWQHDTDLHQDPDGDGVSLLMAYALNLDPRLNPRGSLPVPMLDENTLRMSFHATSPGIIYRAETSTDLQTWTTSGVTRSAPGPDGLSTAAVPLAGPRHFLRLAVEN